MRPPTHIFIVGAARSGTTLARNLLNSSPGIAICGESCFFQRGRFRPSFRQELRKAGDLSTEAGVLRVVDRIYEDAPPRSYWRWLHRSVEPEELRRRLLDSDRTERALFDLLMELYAGGQPIRGEKTPAHVYAVPTLLKWFPGARIVHMIRDPRAVYVSARIKRFNGHWDTPLYLKLRRSWLALSLYLSWVIASRWLDCAQLDGRYRRSYPGRYISVRFEDLVTEPRKTADKLCRLLEVEFEEGMLQQRVYDSSFGTGDAPVEGFDVKAVSRWRDLLHPLLNRWFVFRCRQHLQAYGYEP